MRTKSETLNDVFIVDDSPVVRERLVTLISELRHVAIVGQADIAFEAITAGVFFFEP